MKSQTWLAEHDLSLTFDRSGRLWKFRPATGAHSPQPVDAHLAGDAIVLSVTVAGLESGDVDLCSSDDVLQVRGRVDRTRDLACDVGMPVPVVLGAVQTTYDDGVLEIRVPLRAAEDDKDFDAALECVPVAL